MDDKKRRYIELTSARLKLLHNERKRTQTGPHKLLKGTRNPKHQLGAHIIERWLSGQRSARLDQFNYVLKLYSALPTYVELTEERREAIGAEIERTALSIPALLKKIEQAPADLTVRKVENWLAQTKHAKEEHYDFVLNLLRSQPDNIQSQPVSSSVEIHADDPDFDWLKRRKKRARPVSDSAPRNGRAERITITGEMRELLNAEFERTGVSINSLTLSRPDEIPGLEGNKISRWRTGRTKQTHKREWDYILGTLKSLPSKRG